MARRNGGWVGFWALGLVAVSGCRAEAERKEPPPAPGATAGAVSEKAALAPAATASPMKEKEHVATAAERLGKLPDGFGVPAGQQAPDFTVESSDGRRVSLRDLTAKGPVLLVFYRGGWCPFCSFQIRELVRSFPEYRQRGVTPVAISVDRVEEAAKTGATYEIPFPVLSDPDLAAHAAFRVLHTAQDAEVERLRGFGVDIEKVSGRKHHQFAVPSLFLVDTAGRVRWAHADPDYKTRPRTPQILAAIDEAKL